MYCMELRFSNLHDNYNTQQNTILTHIFTYISRHSEVQLILHYLNHHLTQKLLELRLLLLYLLYPLGAPAPLTVANQMLLHEMTTRYLQALQVKKVPHGELPEDNHLEVRRELIQAVCQALSQK